MSNPLLPNPLSPPPGGVVEVASDAADPAAIREVFRAHNRLAVSVLETPRDYRVTYTLRDIHHLTFLTHEERTAVAAEWHAWHREHVRLGPTGVILWVAGAALTGLLWANGDGVANALASAASLTVPLVALHVIGAGVALGLLVTLPGFLAACSASALCDAYLRGYADGVTRGVNRALRITPELERELWDELRDAVRTDAAWRRAHRTDDRTDG